MFPLKSTSPRAKRTLGDPGGGTEKNEMEIRLLKKVSAERAYRKKTPPSEEGNGNSTEQRSGKKREKQGDKR